MYSALMVPLDGSAFAEHALPLALDIARRASAALRLVLVHVPVASAFNANELANDLALDAAVREQEQAYLRGVLQRLATASPVRATGQLVDGPVAGALCGQAAAPGTDLVIMTTHGRGPLTRLWLGSVADRLVRQAPTPVLLIRPREGEPDLAQPPALRHVVIPLDGSELAEQVLGPATTLGRLMGADYTLLRVIEPVVLPDRRLGGNAAGGFDPVLLRRLQEEAQAYLEGVAGRLREQSLTVRTRLVTNRTAARAIRDQAREQPAAVIALATHGRGGLSRLLLGSVADKVARTSPVPVLVYRPRGG